jgi:hypothetical protein
MEGCYNGFLDLFTGPHQEDLVGFTEDLCGYMYLFNYNRTVLAQYANLGYYQGVADVEFRGVGYYRAPSTNVTEIPPDVLFKDLGMNSAYGGQYGYNPVEPAYFPQPYLGLTLYANMVCIYEHWAVRAPFCSPAGHHALSTGRAST